SFRRRPWPRRRARSRPRRAAVSAGRARPAARPDYPRAMTDFRLLGPLEVFVEGRPVELPRGKPRALLARLLLDAGRVVSVETLVESLWGDPAPPSAHKVLQVYVSQLRKAIGAQRIVTRSPGYLLLAERDEYDLGRFETLAEAARGT